MARKPQRAPAPRTVESLLREIEKLGPPPLVAPNRGTGDGGAAMVREIENRFASTPGMTEPPQGPAARNTSAGLLAPIVSAAASKPNIGNGVDALGSGPRRRGLLSSGEPETSGLLSGKAPVKPRPAAPQPQERSPLARVGNFADDLLFGGNAGDRREERRQREQQQAFDAAHRDAFAYATRGGSGLDPALYASRLAELGQAPDMSGMVGLEGMTDSRDIRGARGREERREVQAGAFAPVTVAPEDQRDGVLSGALDYLNQQGFGYEGATEPGALNAVVGGGMGANAYLDNRRGDLSLEEQRRSNMAGEQYREQDFGFRQNVDTRNFGYQRERDAADDQYRNSRAEAEDAYRAWQQQNDFSRSDIEGQVLRKAIQGGAASLTPEEKQVYDRAVTASTGFGWPGMPGGGVPGVPSQPAPQAQPQPQAPGNAARPQSQADFDALPAGALYIDPDDGNLYRK